MRDKFVGDEAPGLFFEQDKVFAHPFWSRNIECIHRVVFPHLGNGEPSLLFGRILHVIDFVDLRVLGFAVHFLNSADIDGLHDVAGIGVDRYLAARLSISYLWRQQSKIAVGLAAGLFQRLVDQMHAGPSRRLRIQSGLRLNSARYAFTKASFIGDLCSHP